MKDKMTGICRVSISMVVIITICISLKAQEKIIGLLYYDSSPVSIEIRDGLIMQVSRLDKLPEGLSEIYIAPGFIDNQINGFAGVSFSLGSSDLTSEGVENVTRELWKNGVTTYLPALTTNSKEVLVKNLSLLSGEMVSGKLLGSIPGFPGTRQTC